MRRKRKHIVIDCSVAHASGGPDASFPTSKKCRDFLMEARSKSYRMVMTPEIRDEWNRHMSAFSMQWLTTMYRIGLVSPRPSYEDQNLRDCVVTHARDEFCCAAMLKDCHLIEAALNADLTVASLDNKVRRLFAELSEHVKQVEAVVWVKPDVDEETPLEWLRSGAPPDAFRTLGAYLEQA